MNKTLLRIYGIVLPAVLTAVIACDNGTAPGQVVKPLEIVAPKGGEMYTAGQVLEIKWKINDAAKISSVCLKISMDNGKSFSLIVPRSIPTDTTQFSWTTGSEHVSSQCVIKVYDYEQESIFDKSGPFTISP